MNFYFLIFYLFAYSQACRLSKNCRDCTSIRCKFLIANNGESICSSSSLTRIGMSFVITEIRNAKFCPVSQVNLSKFTDVPISTSTSRPKRKLPSITPANIPIESTTMKVYQMTTATTDKINMEKEKNGADKVTILPFNVNKTSTDIDQTRNMSNITITIPQTSTSLHNSLWIFSTIILFAILILSIVIILVLVKLKKINVHSNFRRNRQIRNIRPEVYGLGDFGNI